LFVCFVLFLNSNSTAAAATYRVSTTKKLIYTMTYNKTHVFAIFHPTIAIKEDYN
jgi:hypothetical protein